MGNEKKHKPLISLDDPAEIDPAITERPPSTKRPAFDTHELARHIETAEDRATVPPSPTYDMLRDSCRNMAAAAVADDLLAGKEPEEEEIDDADVIEERGLDPYPSTSAVHAKNSPTAQAARAAVEAANARKKRI